MVRFRGARAGLALAGGLALSACHVGRFFYYNFADLRDNRKFPARAVATAGEPGFRFAAGVGARVALPRSAEYKGKTYDFEGLLRATGTVALLVVRHDTLVLEQYREGYAAGSEVPSFSMAKSFVSALVGAALADGAIKSVDDPITRYLPELTQPGFERVTLRHLLQMRSGIAFDEGYFNPFGEVAKFYYGRSLPRYVRRLRIKEAPGQRFEYVSVNPQLLGMAVARATGQPLAEYLQQKIWQPLGMEYPASWSLDRRGGTEKGFCCLNARARDFARFGRLYLRHGDWQGRAVLPRAWVDASVYDPATQAPNNFLYSYQWWHNRRFEALTDTTRHGAFREVAPGPARPGAGPAPARVAVRPAGDFMAVGLLGQYIYVNPRHDFILVRLGRKEGFNWGELGRALAERGR